MQVRSHSFGSSRSNRDTRVNGTVGWRISRSRVAARLNLSVAISANPVRLTQTVTDSGSSALVSLERVLIIHND